MNLSNVITIISILTSIVSVLFAGISAIVATVSLVIAFFVWRVAKRTMTHQALIDVHKDYRSPEMLYAVDILWNFSRKHGKDNLVQEYENIRAKEKQKILNIDNHEEREKAVRNSLHYHRRLVSHFYQHLAALYVNNILTKDIVYKNWSEADLRIIPEVLIPIENKLREVLHKPPLGPLDLNCALLVLYRDSKIF
jgi:hypothetical protein